MALPIEHAEPNLSGLLARLRPGEEVEITSNGLTVARVKKADAGPGPSRAGCYCKNGFWMSPDFDAPLDDFREYME